MSVPRVEPIRKSIDRDLIAWYASVSERMLGKAAIAIGFAIASTYAYGLAGQKIALIIQATPTNFTRALVLTAILQIPFLIAIAGAFISAFCIIASSLLMLPWALPWFHSIADLFLDRTATRTTQRFTAVTRLFQVIFFALFGLTVFSLSQKYAGWYDGLTSNLIRDFVYDLDMYPGLECKMEKGQKLAPLGDSRFLIASRTAAGEIVFSPPQQCDD